MKMNRQEKTALSNIKAWNNTRASSLSDVYGKYSANKCRAFSYCKELCYQYDGSDLKIISHNVYIFTAGFQFIDKDTGVIKFMFITPSYNTIIDMQ